MIIYGWQQLEEIRENVLRLTATRTKSDRRIISPRIPNMANGKRLSRLEKRQIHSGLGQRTDLDFVVGKCLICVTPPVCEGFLALQVRFARTSLLVVRTYCTTRDSLVLHCSITSSYCRKWPPNCWGFFCLNRGFVNRGPSVYNCPSRKTQKIFNSIPDSVRNLTTVTTDTFKFHLDEWLKTVQDQRRGGGYSVRVAAESNSIQHQAAIMQARK